MLVEAETHRPNAASNHKQRQAAFAAAANPSHRARVYAVKQRREWARDDRLASSSPSLPIAALLNLSASSAATNLHGDWQPLRRLLCNLNYVLSCHLQCQGVEGYTGSIITVSIVGSCCRRHHNHLAAPWSLARRHGDRVPRSHAQPTHVNPERVAKHATVAAFRPPNALLMHQTMQFLSTHRTFLRRRILPPLRPGGDAQKLLVELTIEFSFSPIDLHRTDMNGKADIAFLLNPKAKAQTLNCPTPSSVEDNVVTPPATPPPMSLFRSLSPVVRFPDRVALSLSPTRKMPASFEPVYGKHFSNVRYYGDDYTRLPMLSLAAMYAANGSNSSSSSVSIASVASSEHSDEELRTTTPHLANPVNGGKTRVRKTHTPPCQVEGCKNLAVSRGCCVRHGGGSRCTVAGCSKRAKLYQRCFQHGGFKTCTEPGCTKKAKRYGHCWSHGGGRICEIPDCTKVSTQGGLCWAHGGGNRCKLDGCSRRSYQKYGYYCVHHSKLCSDSDSHIDSNV